MSKRLLLPARCCLSPGTGQAQGRQAALQKPFFTGEGPLPQGETETKSALLTTLKEVSPRVLARSGPPGSRCRLCRQGGPCGPKWWVTESGKRWLVLIHISQSLCNGDAAPRPVSCEAGIHWGQDGTGVQERRLPVGN